MSDRPSSQTLRLAEGRERRRYIVCDRRLRLGEWPGANHYYRKRRLQTYGDAERHTVSNIATVCGTNNLIGCHGWIHRHPEQARALGYLPKSYDPEPGTVLAYSVRRGWILFDTDGQRTHCPLPKGMSQHPAINRREQPRPATRST